MLQDPIAALQDDQLIMLARGRALHVAVVPSSMYACLSQRWTECSEIPMASAICERVSPLVRAAMTPITLELRWVALRHQASFPRAVGPR